MVSFQAARADAAEQRCRDIEAKFVRMLNDLADELEVTGSDIVNPAQSDPNARARLAPPERAHADKEVLTFRAH
jgi:hypothetical protein